MDCSNWGIFIWLGSIFGYVVQFFYNIFNNYGVAIIFFTIFTRLLMFPLSITQQKSMAAQQRLQPKLAELKQKYGNDKNAYNEATQALYAKEGVSPSGGCLPTLIQLPLFFGMYMAIRRPLYCVLHIADDTISKLAALLNVKTTNYYYEIDIINKLRTGVGQALVSGSDLVSSSNAVASAADVVSGSGVLTSASDIVSSTDMTAVAALLGDRYDHVIQMCNSFRFLGIDLLQTAGFWNPALILAVLVFILQAGSMIVTNKINKVQSTQGCNQNVMAVGMGAFSLFIAFSIPAAFPLYWATTSLLTPAQSWVTKEFFGPVIMNAKAEAERNARVKLNEQAIIDEINSRKGRILLAPEEPKERAGGEGIQGGSSNTNKKNQKKNGGKGGSSDYRGRKK